MSVAISQGAGTEGLDSARPVSENTGRIDALLSLAVLAGIGVVAWTDHAVETFSLGYLYLLPLALSALVHPLSLSLVLALLCVVLHDWLGPFVHEGAGHYLWSLWPASAS